MLRFAAVAILTIVLAGCDAVDSLKEGFQHARAVESDLEHTIGLRPQVGFNWKNGRLVSVTVAFPRLYEDKPLHELADVTRTAVAKEFKQAPENLLLAFTVGTN